jgi:hypothetical protein
MRREEAGIPIWNISYWKNEKLRDRQKAGRKKIGHITGLSEISQGRTAYARHRAEPVRMYCTCNAIYPLRKLFHTDYIQYFIQRNPEWPRAFGARAKKNLRTPFSKTTLHYRFTG